MIERLITLPGRMLRWLWHFIEPPLKVGRIPFGRTVLVLQAIAAATFLGYTFIKKEIKFPILSSEPFLVDVMLPDAKGLNPAKEPAAGVAGAPAGKVTEVKVEGGQARVTLRLNSDLKGKIFKDATAQVRPTSVLQTLIVNIAPGNPETGELADGEAIAAANTSSFVHIDELTGILDADTQAQLQVLIHEAATALRGREPELREILAELGRLTDAATPLAEALNERRRLLMRLTGHLDKVFGTLGSRGRQLASAIDLGSRTLEVTSEREPELTEATRGLAPALAEAQRALAASRGLAEPLAPALNELVPVARELQPTASKLRQLAPELDSFVGLAERLVNDGRRPVKLLARGLKGQARRVRADQIPALKELLDLVDLLDTHRDGLVQFAEGISGATSTNRRAGTYTQFDILNVEVPEGGFGLGSAASRNRAGKPSKLSRMLAEMLEHTCRDSNPAACLIRFNLPGLPVEPLLDPVKKVGEGG